MAKVHPQALHGSTSFTSKQETFTIWMKSLVLNGKGCTVFDSDGQIVYRVDNYNCKSRDEVYLMDRKGGVLFTILRKQSKLSRFWEGYRSTASEKNQNEPSFRVRKTCRTCIRASAYQVVLGLDKSQPYCLEIESSTCKSSCNISDQFGELVAELKRKKSTCGVDFGDDVLTMVVEPNIDLSLIMGLVVAYSLINCKI
ncbi:hypothetical protein L6164_004144 [Bauhinia variegata]|uniref:Uncharacterized protein n=1 Tax=Bauhinia variegata TaxID=167791 RepID=A0ACB9Q3J6_BAUVA|nr:hypothetical protein L6164_004144 [Bauhinia variegata]